MIDTELPQPPILPRPPAPLPENATLQQRSDYQARLTRYNAELRVYEVAAAAYQRALRNFVSDPTPTQPQPLIADPAPVEAVAVLPAPAPAAPVPAPGPAPEARIVEFGGYTFAVPIDLAPLSLATNLANAAIANDVPAGDLRWRYSDREFTWPASDGTQVPMDHQTLIQFAQVISDAAER